MTEFNVDTNKMIYAIIPESESQSEFESLDHDDQIDEILAPKNVTENYLKGIRSGVERAINTGVSREELKKVTNWLNPAQSQLRQLIDKYPDDTLLLQKLVKNAVMLGRAIGQNNTFTHFEGAINQGFKNKESTQKGNEIAQAKRRAKTEGDREKCRAEAEKLWKIQGSLNLPDMAVKVLKETGILGVGPRTVEGYIRDLNPKSKNLNPKNKVSLASETDQSG